jgi:4-hydroxybenzoate polyprenyltransferase
MSAVLRALRVQQWVKNALVFMPLLMAPEIGEPARYVNAFMAFLALSLCASCAYVLNDMLDVEADRRHAVKSRRPFASGELSVAAGAVLGMGTLVLGVGIASLLPRAFMIALFAYVTASTTYSLWLKHVPLVDVIVLAMLYAGRVMAGGAATYVVPSPWLIGFSGFLFLSLAFVKRYSELYALRHDRSSLQVRGYRAGDLELITVNGTASGYMAVLVAALYINGDRASGIYHRPELLWLICPVLMYWISRIWMLAHRGELHDDPVLFAVTDRTSYVVGALVGLILIAARW